MGSTACSAQKNVDDLISLYELISSEKLEDEIQQEFAHHKMKSFSYFIPKKQKQLYNFLRGKGDDDAFIQQESQRLQNIQQISDNIQFLKSLRYYGVAQLLELEKTYKYEDYTYEILNLCATINLYVHQVSGFLKKCGAQYYPTLYVRLWEKYQKKIMLLEQIYTFKFVNSAKYDGKPFKFTFQKLSSKLWAHQIQMNMSTELMLKLFEEQFDNSQNKKSELQKYFQLFLEISISQEQIEYCGNVGLKFSEQFMKFQSNFQQALKQKFSANANPIDAVLNWVELNQFMNQAIPQNIKILKLLPLVNQYLNEELNVLHKLLFNAEKQYLISFDKEKSFDEVEKSQTKSQFTFSSQCKTSYSSFYKVNNHLEQEETSFYNYRENKWQKLQDVDKNKCNQFLSYKLKIENQEKQIIKEKNKIFKIFDVKDYKQQEFMIQAINILGDNSYQINNKEIDDLDLGFCLYF